MNKNVWTRPLTMVQRFEANEYVAACENKGKYLFECTAPGGALYYYPRSDGNIDGQYEGNGSAWPIGSYHPCGAKHEADVTDDFYDGFIDYNRNRRHDDGEGVIVWRGSWGLNGHATVELNMDEWEKTPS